tara:strand:+ start:2392 stop:3090 length:699 start_codon:yes stop_codon:yes gene_type:complete
MVDKEKNRINEVYENYLLNKEDCKKWSSQNYGNSLIENEKLELIKKFVDPLALLNKTENILDIGCANGRTISLIKKIGFVENIIYGVDLRENRLNDAKILYPKSKFKCMDARYLSFPNNSFDIVSIFTVFSSIIRKIDRIKVATQIDRVLKPEGIVIFYDLRYGNPFNYNVIGIKYSEIDELFPGYKKKIKPVTLLPPISRMIGRKAKFLYNWFSKISSLKTHYLGIMTKDK